MAPWLARLLIAAWALFSLWFGVASGIRRGLPWQGVALRALGPGLVLVVIALIAWFWPTSGSVLLIVTGFVLAASYAIYFGHMPTSTKLFVLSTIALPPLVFGLILLRPTAEGTGNRYDRVSADLEEDLPDFNTVPPMLRTVLIADSDAAFRKHLAMPLAARGFTIYEAADGTAAWQLAVQNRPWLILADTSLPGVDGFEFCRRVRNHMLLSRLPLLFISGSDKYKDRYHALQVGADDFLPKNMPRREVLMRIQLLMSRYSDLSTPVMR